MEIEQSASVNEKSDEEIVKENDNFVKADSESLPKVDAVMVAVFFGNNTNFYSAEKTKGDAKKSYGDDAIGYVKLRRECGLCILKGKINPEFKARAASYNVSMVVNEDKEEIVSCQCMDCPAGQCQHALAFLMWTHRRSEEPPKTKAECYWNKSKLNEKTGSMKFITLEQMCKKKTPAYSPSTAFLTEFLEEAKKRKLTNCPLLKYQSDFQCSYIELFSFHHFLIEGSDEVRNNVNKLLEEFEEKLDRNTLGLIERSTKKRNPLWHELRYARVTASRGYEVSRCETPDELIDAIMGAKIPESAMKRHRKALVIKTVQKKIQKKVKPCGLFLSCEYPMVVATPDGICSDAVVEIKCPTTELSKSKYINNGVISEKYLAEMQLQMHLANKKKGYFCVAHPNYKTSKKVDIILMELNDVYATYLLDTMASFWKSNIYQELIRSTS